MHLKNWFRSWVGILVTGTTVFAGLITIWTFFTEDEPKAPPEVSAPIIRGTEGVGKIGSAPAFLKGSIREGAGLIELRAKSGVRELRGTEESAPISELPNGVFGFMVHRWPDGSLDRLDGWPLHRKKNEVYSLEVHKTREGEILLFGYASEGDLGRLLSSAGDGGVEVFILFEPKSEYRFPVGIPLSRLIEWDSRRGDELGNFARIKLRKP